MSEERAPYDVPGADVSAMGAEQEQKTARWIDIRFSDGKHTGVRVLIGTTIIEVRRDGRERMVDVAEIGPLDLSKQTVYNG